MTNTKQYDNIPIEKFQFAKRNDLNHDKKFDTKPVSYFQGAFRRFCKNKGAVVAAIVIAILVLFAIIAPLCTPYKVTTKNELFASARPRNPLFVNTNFWDGCRVKETSYLGYLRDYALGAETGKGVIKNNKVEIIEDEDGGHIFKYRYDTYYGVGFGKYQEISEEEFNDIQRYQNETGRQVLYPIVKGGEKGDRPTTKQDKDDANIYYKTKDDKGKAQPVLDEEGNLIPVYWKVKSDSKSSLVAEYNSLRIEGEAGITDEKGDTYYYVYGQHMPSGMVEVRLERYEYYTYEHTQKLKDGIGDPLFLFGTTDADTGGKDIFTCLANGARFSFIFAIVVAIVNLVVGAIWGSISGYFGGKIDLFMERFCEVLGAVPTMIVITLLKYHMGSSSHVLVLFISFFLTGWIGMAGTTRMQFYRFKNQEYVLAARTLGASDARIMFKHIFPNGLGTLVTRCALVIPSMIYTEANLSYLGIINLEAGNITSVGTLISTGQANIMPAPYMVLFPCAFLVLLMLSFNLFGNGLRDAFNPSLRGSED